MPKNLATYELLRTQENEEIILRLSQVHGFRLFNASDLAREIKAKPTITRYNTGCQGWCNPARYTKLICCANCGVRKDSYEGLQGFNCITKAQCTNYFGLFVARHQNCLVAPKVVGDRVIASIRPQLKAIRKPALVLETVILANQKAKEDSKEGPISVISIPAQKHLGVQIFTYKKATKAQTTPDQTTTQPIRNIAAVNQPKQKPSMKTRLNEETLADS
ncbi:hypothetical protein SBOR_10115 [Sclerotinia borealis F-4128]|uniref:Uncharacterized protein n=1 Tax=Sclerotinia borealis (strain F-4128) TaxID=1432307 RepID=W9C4K4_SCLBF|nr:hypothetical protein SBOR_10115 [Sclerotinia borealis F-4128]